VNTRGLPFYARMDERGRGRGYDLEVQSNPLTICMFPEALVELTFKAA
ncbi:major capsid protein, partial [Desulfobulbus alkaliphilus]|nr:major capsid protein [Desulfobulbus alkaliphilus]